MFRKAIRTFRLERIALFIVVGDRPLRQTNPTTYEALE